MLVGPPGSETVNVNGRPVLRPDDAGSLLITGDCRGPEADSSGIRCGTVFLRDAALPVTAVVINDTVGYCGRMAVGMSTAEEPQPPPDMMKRPCRSTTKKLPK